MGRQQKEKPVLNQAEQNSEEQWTGIRFKMDPGSPSGDQSHGDHKGAAPRSHRVEAYML